MKRANSLIDAAAAASPNLDRQIIAGGTNARLMKLPVETPNISSMVNRLPLDKIEYTRRGLRSVRMVKKKRRNSDWRRTGACGSATALSRALLAGASAQLRNKATTGGNLLQRNALLLILRVKRSRAANKRRPG